MNILFATVIFALSHLELVTGLSLPHRRDTRATSKFVSAAVAAVATADGESYDMLDQPSGKQSPMELLDRNMVIACTNRHNCEIICAKAKIAKYATKSSLLDALSASLGEDTLTDAHKLGIQFGRRKSCDKCALVYSNCDNQLYSLARQVLFAADDMISLPKSSNRL